ncbi:hypothetical protein K505DRAFT_416167 [Melanomma pulvis-pyrius CBS 109.77]|uniref:Cupredoxin n=1 Tax=Melanomma pulvis-pyrius CBS 109.77 TaxID=1314802 RepID=A0A6A6XHM8_9PLEO|nr:hypothetical protein K505DRAFT_416167 [Melanomma pulvis-pyrius CBS 109.77]
MSPPSRNYLFQTALVLFFFQVVALCLGADSSSFSSPPSILIAASSSTGTKPSPTTTAAAQTHTVTVGNGDHKFRPDVTQAKVGDFIEFTFYPANHSVVRAEYQFPCIPYEMTGRDKIGFFSGFKAVDAFLSNPPKYLLKINDTDPIFFYCSAPGSCITYGMVGVINPNAMTSLARQRQLALDSSYMLQPGDPFPAEASILPTSSTTPSPSPLPTPPGGSGSSSSSSSKKGLSPAAIAGISVGAVCVLILGALLFFFIGRSRSLKEEMVRKASTIRHNHMDATSPSSTFFAHASPGGEAGLGLDPGSAGSRRSVGGTFALNQTTGCYARTYEGSDTYKYAAAPPPSADPASPDAYANWSRAGLQPTYVLASSYPPCGIDEKCSGARSPDGMTASPTPRPTPRSHLLQSPVEMDGTEVAKRF